MQNLNHRVERGLAPAIGAVLRGENLNHRVESVELDHLVGPIDVLES